MQIYAQRIGSRTATALTSGPDNSSPAFSPDGERIAFRSERNGGGVFLMTASGESVTRVSDEGYTPSWSPNADELVLAHGPVPSNDASASVPGLIAVEVASGRKRDAATGGRRQLTAVRGYMIGASLSVSTDDTWYTYTETGTEGDIWIARIKKP